MGRDLFPLYQQHLFRANEILGYSLDDLCLCGPVETLNRTEFTQPAIFVVTYLRYLEYCRAGVVLDAAGGHSVGEYAALCAAGSLSFENALKLVHERGKVMAEVTGGGLVAIPGHSFEEVTKYIRESQAQDIEIALVNMERQVVVGGLFDELTKLEEYCALNDIRAVRLRVSGPFHTKHMATAAAKFGAILDQVEFVKPEVIVVSNVTARGHRLETIRESLREHLIKPVQWARSLEFLRIREPSDFLEAGDSGVLASFFPKARGDDSQPIPSSLRMVSSSNPHSRWSRRRFLACTPDVGTDTSEFETAVITTDTYITLNMHGCSEEKVAKLSKMRPGAFGIYLRSLEQSIQEQRRLLDLCRRYSIGWILAEYPTKDLYEFMCNSDRSTSVLLHLSADSHAPTLWEAADGFLLESGDTRSLTINRNIEDIQRDALQVISNIENRNKRRYIIPPFVGRKENTRQVVGLTGVDIGTGEYREPIYNNIDFLVGTSVFLYSSEIKLSERQRDVVMNAREDDLYELLDWAAPRFGLRRKFYVETPLLGKALRKLDEMYSGPHKDQIILALAELESVAIPPGSENYARITLSSGLSNKTSWDIRATIAAAVRGLVRDSVIPGDCSLWKFNSRKATKSAHTRPVQQILAMMID